MSPAGGSCLDGKIDVTNTYQCTTIEPGYYLKPDKTSFKCQPNCLKCNLTNCIQCDTIAPFQIFGDKCLVPNCETYDPASKGCSKCLPGFFLNAQKTCDMCSSGCLQCSKLAKSDYSFLDCQYCESPYKLAVNASNSMQKICRHG